MALVNFVQLADALDYDGVAVQHVWQAEDTDTGQLVEMYFDLGTSPADAQSQMGDADTAEKPPADPIQSMEPKWQYNTDTKEYCVFGDDGLKLFAIKRDAGGNTVLTMFDTAGDPVINPSCRVFTTAGQSIPDNVWTRVDWPDEDYNAYGMHDVAVNNSRITIPTGQAGKYPVSASLSFSPNDSGTRGIRIVKNGNPNDTGRERTVTIANGGPFGSVTAQVADVLDLTDGDFLEVYALQNNGAALTLLTGAHRNHFAVTKL